MDNPSMVGNLATEAVQGAALPLQGVHHIQSSHGLAAGVLGVGDGITDNVLQEHLQHTASLLIDETADALHTATASQTADGGLGDALDVIAKDLAVTLSATLAQSFTALASSRHVICLVMYDCVWRKEEGKQGERGGAV